MAEYEKNRFGTDKITFETNCYRTIRQTAALGIITEYKLRCMYKAGELPGINSGSRFLVNVRLLIEKLDEMSKKMKLTIRRATNYGMGF